VGLGSMEREWGWVRWSARSGGGRYWIERSRRSGGGSGGACIVVEGGKSFEAGSRWVVAMAKRGMLSTWLGGVGGLAGSKLGAVRLVPRLGSLGMVVAGLVVVGIVGVEFVCIAMGVYNPSVLSRRMTSWELICSIVVEGWIARALERVLNIRASSSSLARIALFS
jgi:hypothetical protein